MKRFPLIVLVIVTLLPAAFGQKTRYGQEPAKAKAGVDYPITIHVAGIHLRTDCQVSGEPVTEHCRDVVYADALLNEKKIELMGYWIWTNHTASDPISLGEHQARLIKGLPKSADSPIGEQYELVLPDRTVWRATVTGISE